MDKFLALIVALMIVVASMSALAENNGQIAVTTNFKDQTYKLYQIFDAVVDAGRTDGGEGISYKLMSGKNDFKATPTGGTEIDGSRWFKVDSVGNVTLAEGVTSITFDDTFKAWAIAYGNKIGNDLTAASDNDTNVKWTGLADGYYFISTTTGSLVTVDSITPNVNVEDKNSIPGVDKKITGASNISDEGKKALAQIGTDVTYTAVVTVGKGSKNLVFHDKMDTGLTFKGNTDVTVVSDDIEVGANWYEIKATPDSGDTITITFKDGLKEGSKITITYKATINENALTALENDAKVTYGDNNTSTQESKTKTYNAEIAVVKYDGAKANNKFLGGAGFKLKNSEGKYYKLTGTVVSWEDTEAAGDEHTSSTSDGKVPAFTGLAAGTYTLVETTVPAGYNKAADVPVTIAEADYSTDNLSQTKEIENNKGTELPSTGGMGTTLLYVVGSILVLAAVVLLVTKRRMSNED